MPPTDTPTAFPVRMPTEQAAEYLAQVHGLPIDHKTLRNWRSQGTKGPRCRYLGTKPLYERQELDRWGTEEALTDTNPISVTRRARRAEKLGEQAGA